MYRHLGWFFLAVPWLFHFFNPAPWLDVPGGRQIALHLLHLLYVAGVIALLYRLGRGALRGAHLWPGDRAERILLGVCAGFLIVYTALFLMAAAGLLQRVWVWALAAGGCLLAAWRGRAAAAPSAGAEAPGLRSLAALVLGGLLALLMLGSLLEALYAWPQTPDGLAYQLAYPRLFALEGGFHFTPESPVFFAVSGYWEVFLSGTALFVSSDASLMVLAQLFHLTLGLGGTALGIFCLIRRWAPARPEERLALGLFGAALFAGMRPDVQHVRLFPLLAVTAKSDLIVAALQVAALLALFQAAEAAGRRRTAGALFTGLLLGAAAGVKFTGGLAALALGAAFVLYPSGSLPGKERGRIALWAGAGVALALAPMLIKNAAALGNPVYPAFASLIGGYGNPLLFGILAGLRIPGEGWTGLPILLLALPSAAFYLLAGALWPKLAPRPIYTVLLAIVLSSVIGGFVFSHTFPLRYVLFIPALSAVCAACAAGGVLRRLHARGENSLASRAQIVFWAVLFAAAILPTHLDNRLKRAAANLSDARGQRARLLEANETSRFQAGWPGRLPRDARPLTFYRPERLIAFSAGWRPVVAIEVPALARLFAAPPPPEALEAELRRRGFTHLYFQSARPVPAGFPIRPAALVAHLRQRPPLWRAGGFELYALGAKAPPGQ